MKQRPVFLNLFLIRFPITAIASILHRISGVILFLLIPVALWLLQQSLASEKFYHSIATQMDQLWFKLIVGVMLAGFIYHAIAGIRHIIHDCGVAESKCGGTFSAYLVLILSAISIGFVGYWLW